jgi:hypothetical protein
MRRRHAAVWPALALWTVGGCGNLDTPPVSGSMEEVTVTGVVRVKGKPVTNGLLGFRTANVRRPNAPRREVAIGKDGRYTVKTLVGENFVEVSCKEIHSRKNRELMENEQKIMVPSGEATIDIDVPPKPPAGGPG